MPFRGKATIQLASQSVAAVDCVDPVDVVDDSAPAVVVVTAVDVVELAAEPPLEPQAASSPTRPMPPKSCSARPRPQSHGRTHVCLHRVAKR